jgi:hypothetical protein
MDGKNNFRHNKYVNVYNQIDSIVLNDKKTFNTNNMTSSMRPFYVAWSFGNSLVMVK